MTVTQIIDKTLGTRIDIVKVREDTYRLDYYETIAGDWRFVFSDNDWSRDAIEYEYDVTVA